MPNPPLELGAEDSQDPESEIPSYRTRLLANNDQEDARPELEMASSDRDALPVMTLRRHVYTQDDVEAIYKQNVPKKTYKERFQKFCTSDRVIRSLLGYVPIIGRIRHYCWRRDLLDDFTAGLSVAFLHLPMGIALGILASLPPIYGLYTNFFHVTFYFIFGTGAHVSMGANALLSLLTATAVDRELESHMESLRSQVIGSTNPLTTTTDASTLSTVVSSAGISSTVMSSTTMSSTPAALLMSKEDQESYRVGVAMSMSFISGAILLGLGLCKFGFLTSFLSASFMGGFTTAAAAHISTSQVPKILGITIESYTGPGKLVRTWIAVFENIGEANVADCIIGFTTIIILLIVVDCVNVKHQDKLKVPVPIHLILVIVATIISHFADLEDKFDIAVVGDLDTGFKAPKFPKTEVMGSVAMESFIIAILGYAMTISLAKLMAKKHGYEIDDDQELVAYGMCSFLGSFFGTHPGCTAPPRVMLLSNAKARTTFNGVFTAMFLFVIIMVAGPLFVSLPMAVLAAMICIAVKNLLLQVTQLPGLWRTQKPDFLIWLMTCLTGVLVNLDIGVAVGVLLSVFTIIVLSMLTPSQVCSVSNTEDLVLQGQYREGTTKLDGIKVFYFPSQLYFANSEKFKRELFKEVLNPASVKNLEKAEADGEFSTINVNGQMDHEKNGVNGGTLSIPQDRTRVIILDCSAMTYIDLSGVNMLKHVVSAYTNVDVQVFLARCPRATMAVLERTAVFDVLPRDHVVYDVHDALRTLEVQTIIQPSSKL